MAGPPADGSIAAAVRATYTAFAAMGFAFASWASRIPQVKAHLRLDPSELGLVLLAIAAGSVLALPLAGAVVARFGSRRTVTAMSVLVGSALLVVAAGSRIGVPALVVGLFALGIGGGTWDVAMNVQGARVERRLGRAIMSRFHAAFSLGTVAGALGGAAMVALRVPVTVHLAVVGAAVGVSVPVAVRAFVADAAGVAGAGDAGSAGRAFRAWREPRTLLVGAFVLAFALGEGAGNDWISVAAVDDRGFSAAVGALTFACFLAAMTSGRWVGTRLLDAYGRVAVIRAAVLVALVGLALFAFAPGPVAAFAGAVLWGVGVSLGFPVGMSAGADEPAHAAARVGVISSIGYLAFLGGPPVIGLLGQRLTVLHALAVIIVLLLPAGLLAGVVRERAPGDAAADRDRAL